MKIDNLKTLFTPFINTKTCSTRFFIDRWKLNKAVIFEKYSCWYIRVKFLLSLKPSRRKLNRFFRPKLYLFFSQFIFWISFLTERLNFFYESVFYSIWLVLFFRIGGFNFQNNGIFNLNLLYKKNFYYSHSVDYVNKFSTLSESYILPFLTPSVNLKINNYFLRHLLLNQVIIKSISLSTFSFVNLMSSKATRQKKKFRRELRKAKRKAIKERKKRERQFNKMYNLYTRNKKFSKGPRYLFGKSKYKSSFKNKNRNMKILRRKNFKGFVEKKLNKYSLLENSIKRKFNRYGLFHNSDNKPLRNRFRVTQNTTANKNSIKKLKLLKFHFSRNKFKALAQRSVKKPFKYEKFLTFLKGLKRKNSVKGHISFRNFNKINKVVTIIEPDGFEIIPLKDYLPKKFFKNSIRRKTPKSVLIQAKPLKKRYFYYWSSNKFSRQKLMKFDYRSPLISYRHDYLNAMPKVADPIIRKKKNEFFVKNVNPSKRKRKWRKKRFRSKLIEKGKTFVKKLKRRRRYIPPKLRWFNRIGFKMKLFFRIRDRKKFVERFDRLNFNFGL